MNCLSENILRAYRDAEEDATQRAAIEEHLAGCPSCQEQLQEIDATAAHVKARLLALDAPAAQPSVVDPQIALSRFNATYHPNSEPASSTSRRFFARRWRPAWVSAAAAAVILCGLAFPSGRGLAQRFLSTLRVEKVQPVALDFSALDGNRPLQEMLRQMISEQVVVTADEKPQSASTASSASQLAGFPVHVLAVRTDAPKFTVEGQHAFHMTVDRARLQDIFDQAGRSDLLLPVTLEGAPVSINVPRSIRLEYGDCPHAHATATPQSAPAPSGTWSNCLALVESPAPVVSLPSDLNIQQLAEIGFQLAGMSATQARELGQTIDWKSTLVLPMPRSASTYTSVQVAGTQGTLITGSGHRGPDYVLILVKNGIIYGLVGHGDSSNAVNVANSLN
jgi:anti-sigma factor RsiW